MLIFQGVFMVAFAWNTVIHEVFLDGWSHATCWHALAARYHFVCCLGCFCATTETWKILKDLSILVYFSRWTINLSQSHVFVKQPTSLAGFLATQIGGCQIFSRMTGWLFQFFSWLYPGLYSCLFKVIVYFLPWQLKIKPSFGKMIPFDYHFSNWVGNYQLAFHLVCYSIPTLFCSVSHLLDR